MKMPISATGNARSAGFTLIELMVVIAILGLASAAVMLNIPDPRGTVVDEAERFAVRSAAVRDEAIMSARETRILVTAAGYRFEQKRRGEWQGLEGRALQDRTWPDGTRARPTIVSFDTNGMADAPRRIQLSRGANSAAIQIDINGAVHVAP